MGVLLKWIACASVAALGAASAIDGAIATTDYVFSDLDFAGITDSCNPVRAWAEAAAKDVLGVVVGEATTLARGLCSPFNGNASACSGGCTYCSTDSKCWPMVDLDNPCHQLIVKALVFGAEAGGTVATAMVDAGIWATSQCHDHNTSDACTGGLGLFCNWCEKNSQCHTKGSALDPCMREEMLILAAETGSALANSVSAAAQAKWAGQKTFCGTYHGNQSNCGEQVQCIWCGSTSVAVNECYFMGDTDNKCMKATIQPYIDAAGQVKPIADWVASVSVQGYENLKNWGTGLCGKHSTSTPCDADEKCYFCADDSTCYVMGSVNSPCGNFQKTKGQMVEKWNKYFGEDTGCAKSLITARAQMKSAVDIVASNLNATCKEFVKTEIYASRSMLALQKDLGNAKDAASELVGTQVARAKQSAVDVFNTRNESMLQVEALAAFDAANPCASETSASRMGVGYLGMPAALISFILRA